MNDLLSLSTASKYGWTYHRKGADDYESAYNARRLESIKRTARSLGYELVPKLKAA